MKVTTKKAFAGLVAAFAFAIVSVLAPVSPVSAQTDCTTGAGGITGGIDCANPAGPGGEVSPLFGEGSIFTTIVNILLFVIGAISVVMLIYGGIRYTVSAGDSARVTAAKNTIMYAIVGLIVAFLAFAIVNWVLTSIGGAA